jgi:hypothetical protein
MKMLIIIMAVVLISCSNGSQGNSNKGNDNKNYIFDLEEFQRQKAAWEELNINRYRFEIYYSFPSPYGGGVITGRTTIVPENKPEFELFREDPPDEEPLIPFSIDEHFEWILEYASNLERNYFIKVSYNKEYHFPEICNYGRIPESGLDGGGTSEMKIREFEDWRGNDPNCINHTPGAAATCTTRQTCTNCGAVFRAELGHNWQWTLTTFPTVEEYGEETGICLTCGEETKRSVDPQLWADFLGLWRNSSGETREIGLWDLKAAGAGWSIKWKSRSRRVETNTNVATKDNYPSGWVFSGEIIESINHPGDYYFETYYLHTNKGSFSIGGEGGSSIFTRQ